MARPRLNIRSIRQRPVRNRAGNPGPAEMINSRGDFQLSRRDMLAAMAMIGTVPLLQSIGTTWLGTVRMQRLQGTQDAWLPAADKFTDVELDPVQQYDARMLWMTAFELGTSDPGDTILAEPVTEKEYRVVVRE